MRSSVYSLLYSCLRIAFIGLYLLLVGLRDSADVLCGGHSGTSFRAVSSGLGGAHAISVPSLFSCRYRAWGAGGCMVGRAPVRSGEQGAVQRPSSTNENGLNQPSDEITLTGPRRRGDAFVALTASLSPTSGLAEGGGGGVGDLDRRPQDEPPQPYGYDYYAAPAPGAGGSPSPPYPQYGSPMHSPPPCSAEGYPGGGNYYPDSASGSSSYGGDAMAAFTAFANTFNLGTDSIANTSALLSSLGIASDFTQYNKEVVFEGLKKLYRKKVLPLEVASKYTHFGHSAMNPSDLDAKPIVLVLGQYSVGKTSFIRSLLKQDFPGQRIGPEPTTDKFTAIMHSQSPSAPDRAIPGHALVMQPECPFSGLAALGSGFLSKLEGVEVSAPILRNVTLIDTPGVLAGRKQREGGRQYDFTEAVKWFASRADLILLFFDAHKLDISDELRAVLDAIRPYQDRLRVVLNKADSSGPDLLRVHGALMWQLGRVIHSPEACRVYLGSRWEQTDSSSSSRSPALPQPQAQAQLEHKALLDREREEVLGEVRGLPRDAIARRIDMLVKRARSVKVHAYIIHYLRKQLPYFLPRVWPGSGRRDKQRALVEGLEREFVACARRYNLPLSDFPPVQAFKAALREIDDIGEFRKLDKGMVADLDRMLAIDIPALLKQASVSTPAPAMSPPPPLQPQQEQSMSMEGLYGSGYGAGVAAPPGMVPPSASVPPPGSSAGGFWGR